MVVVAFLRHERRRSTGRCNHSDLATNQIDRHCGQSIILALCPAIFDHDVLAVDVARFVQALAKRGHVVAYAPGDALLRNPITGIAGCCARAASGHAAAPPSSVMNSRRPMKAVI